eukprot:m.109059 g.109059  ORF g.109059 m.109059 type:complete len:317 (+) comp15951_c0_seq4:158-1108(+)
MASDTEPEDESQCFSLATRLRHHERNIWDLDFSPNHPHICSGGYDGKVKVVDFEGTVLAETKSGPSCYYGTRYSTDGTHIVSGDGDGAMRLFNAELTAMETITVSSRMVNRVVFYPDSNQLAVGTCSSGAVYLTDFRTKANDKLEFAAGGGESWGCEFSRSDPSMLYVGSGHHVVQFDVRDFATPVQSMGFDGTVHDLAVGPDDMLAVTQEGAGTVLVNTESWRKTGHVLHTTGTVSCGFHPTEPWVISGGENTASVEINDYTTSERLYTTLRHTAAVWVTRFSRDGLWAASAGFGAECYLYEYNGLPTKAAGKLS